MIMLAFDLINRTESFPNKCLVTSLSSWPVALARLRLIFVMICSASPSQPPLVSTARAENSIFSALQSSPYFDHFCCFLRARAYPGSLAALSRVACWKGEVTHI